MPGIHIPLTISSRAFFLTSSSVSLFKAVAYQRTSEGFRVLAFRALNYNRQLVLVPRKVYCARQGDCGSGANS